MKDEPKRSPLVFPWDFRASSVGFDELCFASFLLLSVVVCENDRPEYNSDGSADQKTIYWVHYTISASLVLYVVLVVIRGIMFASLDDLHNRCAVEQHAMRGTIR